MVIALNAAAHSVVETFAVALTAQRELAEHGEHRLPIPDLLIASCAQQHGAVCAFTAARGR